MSKKIQVILEIEVQDDDYETDYREVVESYDVDWFYDMLIETDLEDHVKVVSVSVV